MTWLEALILGILQGITEFLPISSSGHLLIGQEFLGLNISELKSFDIIVHVASLLAIFVYFSKDILEMLKAFGKILTFKVNKKDPYAKLILYIIIGTIPAVLLGFFGEEWLDSMFRNVFSVGMWMLIIAVVFLFAEMFYREEKTSKSLSIFKVIFIGCMQAVALIPGVSRSGMTISGGLFAKLKRTDAARFSFLLSMPAIFGAGLLDFFKNETVPVPFISLLIGFIASFLVGLLAITFLMKFLKKHSLIIFAVYLFFIGGSILFLQ